MSIVVGEGTTACENILKCTRCGGVELQQADPEDEGRKEEGRDKGAEVIQNDEASTGSQGDSAAKAAKAADERRRHKTENVGAGR